VYLNPPLRLQAPQPRVYRSQLQAPALNPPLHRHPRQNRRLLVQPARRPVRQVRLIRRRARPRRRLELPPAPASERPRQQLE
jgi:hypothetical protein